MIRHLFSLVVTCECNEKKFKLRIASNRSVKVSKYSTWALGCGPDTDPHPNDLQNLRRLSCPHYGLHFWYNFHEDPISFSRDIIQIVEDALSCNAEESLIPRSGIGWLPKFNLFSLVPRHVSAKIFIKIIWSVRKVASRQTDKQTNGG